MEFFTKIRNYWENSGFEFLALVCLVVILILCAYNITFKKEGTFSQMALEQFKKKNMNIVLNSSDNRRNFRPFETQEQRDSFKMYSNEIAYDSNNNEIEYMQHTPNDSRLELQSKLHLEHILKMPFYKIRPDFLRNDVTGYNLEIDLYNNDLKLGVEVQGDQHYKFTPFFHRNKETFLNQRYRDEMKKQKCMKEGITLIEIPYSVGEKRLKQYIINQLRLTGYLV